ncbi:hypothetical protein D3C75_590500 [compost metagenome]
MDMRIFHGIIPRLQRRFVAPRQSDGSAADMMNVGADNGVVRTRCSVENIVIKPALRIDQHTAVSEITDFAVQDPHVTSAHEHGCRITAVLKHQLREIDV